MSRPHLSARPLTPAITASLMLPAHHPMYIAARTELVGLFAAHGDNLAAHLGVCDRTVRRLASALNLALQKEQDGCSCSRCKRIVERVAKRAGAA